jgi:hypothetical protein
MIRAFRTLVVLAAALFLASPLVDILSPTFVAALSHGQNREDPSGLLISTSGHIATGLAAAAFACFCASAVGLYRLRPWARPLSVVTSVLAVAAFSSLGEVVYAGFAFAMVQAAAAVWGGVLVLAYFSDVSRQFVK